MIKITSAFLLCGIATAQQPLDNRVIPQPAPPAMSTTRTLGGAFSTTTTLPILGGKPTIAHSNPMFLRTTGTTTQPSADETTPALAGVYVLKYAQQACPWSDYVQDEDWIMFSSGEGTDDAAICAADCLSTEGCTGFEVGSDAGETYNNEAYCALWLNGACSAPTSYFDGAFSLSTGEYISVDTYTLTTPIEAFEEYDASGCVWDTSEQGVTWDYADLGVNDPEACAKLCLERSDCTGFEAGDVMLDSTTQNSGYCALWFNNSCTVNDLVVARSSTSTYLLSGTHADGCHDSFMLYMLFTISFLGCLMLCCCCRRAMLRRRIRLQMQMAAAAARRRSAQASVTVPVAFDGDQAPSRGVVYAVRIENDGEQEEPVKQ